MTYTLWLKIENDDGNPGDRDEGWVDLANADTRKEIEAIGDRARKLLGNAGFSVDALEGWHQEEEE